MSDDYGYGSGEDQEDQEIGGLGREQWTHVTEQNTCDTGTIHGETERDIKQNIRRIFANPLDKFKFNTNKIIKELNEKNNLTISPQNRNKICNEAGNIKNITNINPLAFVLGFMVTYGGVQQLEHKVVNHMFKMLDLMDEQSVQKPDIIRYGRYWLKLKNNL